VTEESKSIEHSAGNESEGSQAVQTQRRNQNLSNTLLVMNLKAAKLFKLNVESSSMTIEPIHGPARDGSILKRSPLPQQ